ncbi:MAG: glyoxalase [Planctomycetes bacterium]|nr:glyoxalase [Planctomycetota bacterium]
MRRSLFVLYVADQARSRDFYAAVLGCAPVLDVPGMTEFELEDGAALGLMPAAGIARLLDQPPACFATTPGVSRCELYLVLDDPAAAHARALAAGARELAPLASRDWGQRVAYCADLDGHVLACAGAEPGA